VLASHQTSEERPPEGLARGRWAVSPWVIGALAAVVVCLAVGFVVMRALREKKP
jgi:hypothetical protein